MFLLDLKYDQILNRRSDIRIDPYRSGRLVSALTSQR
jgi:hypothetical protein